MNLFDIVGPIMVGPSSSHTAGAVKIGNVCNKMMGEPIKSAYIFLHGSFAATGKGHGTDRALIAGLLGMAVDDTEIPNAFSIALSKGMKFTIENIDLGDVHPNSVKIMMIGQSGRQLEVVASSIGGGRIEICKLDGNEANFSGENPTLIVRNMDQPGCITEVTSLLGEEGINIATMNLHRKKRGGEAIMVIECDQQVPEEIMDALERLDGIFGVAYFSPR